MATVRSEAWMYMRRTRSPSAADSGAPTSMEWIISGRSLSLSLVFLAVDEFLIGARALKLRRKNEMHYIEGRVESLRDSVAKGKGGAQVSTHSFTRLSCLLLLLLLVLFRVRGGKEVVGSIGGITSLSGISCVSRAKLCVQFRWKRRMKSKVGRVVRQDGAPVA